MRPVGSAISRDRMIRCKMSNIAAALRSCACNRSGISSQDLLDKKIRANVTLRAACRRENSSQEGTKTFSMASMFPPLVPRQ